MFTVCFHCLWVWKGRTDVSERVYSLGRGPLEHKRVGAFIRKNARGLLVRPRPLGEVVADPFEVGLEPHAGPAGEDHVASEEVRRQRFLVVGLIVVSKNTRGRAVPQGVHDVPLVWPGQATASMLTTSFMSLHPPRSSRPASVPAFLPGGTQLARTRWIVGRTAASAPPMTARTASSGARLPPEADARRRPPRGTLCRSGTSRFWGSLDSLRPCLDLRGSLFVSLDFLPLFLLK